MAPHKSPASPATETLSHKKRTRGHSLHVGDGEVGGVRQQGHEGAHAVRDVVAEGQTVALEHLELLWMRGEDRDQGSVGQSVSPNPPWHPP